MGSHDADIKKHVRVYMMVFGALAILTVVTVAVSYLHLPVWPALIVALIIASIKGSLVAGWFMHLVSERKAIYALLILTVGFFVFLMTWPMLDMNNGVGVPSFIDGGEPATVTSGHGHGDGHGEEAHGH